jgi:uncharacterized protein (TIGR00369 family)
MTIPPFNTYLGTQVVRKENGSAEVRLELQPHHLNRRGVAHGGVVTSLLDSALGAAVISAIPPEWWCATTSLSTQFLDGVGEGRLTATGRVLRRGARVAFATGEVRGDDGRLIATATGTWHLWSRRPGLDRQASAFVTLWNGERVRVGKIVAVGRNYADHAAEMKAEVADEPLVFLKPTSALLRDGQTVVLPSGVGAVHHEVELVAVVGRTGRSIPADQALDHVMGYAVGLDMTLRDLQSRAKQRGEPWSLSKGFDGSAPISAVAPADRVGDGSGLDIRLDVNGRIRQQGNTTRMLHTVASLVAFVSRHMTLHRGDLIFTGTPAGVGPVQSGDRLLAEIDRVGTLSVNVEAEDRDGASI